MDMGKAMMVAGIGCRSGVSAEQVDAALEAALRQTALAGALLGLIATPATKGGEAGIIAAASARKVPLLLISQKDLEAANPRTVTRSSHSLQATNVHSVSEAAALAAAGAGSRLLGPRIAVGPVTCALAHEAEPTAPSAGAAPQ